jgi:hypothetical protein
MTAAQPAEDDLFLGNLDIEELSSLVDDSPGTRPGGPAVQLVAHDGRSASPVARLPEAKAAESSSILPPAAAERDHSTDTGLRPPSYGLGIPGCADGVEAATCTPLPLTFVGTHLGNGDGGRLSPGPLEVDDLIAAAPSPTARAVTPTYDRAANSRATAVVGTRARGAGVLNSVLVSMRLRRKQKPQKRRVKMPESVDVGIPGIANAFDWFQNIDADESGLLDQGEICELGKHLGLAWGRREAKRAYYEMASLVPYDTASATRPGVGVDFEAFAKWCATVCLCCAQTPGPGPVATLPHVIMRAPVSDSVMWS